MNVFFLCVRKMVCIVLVLGFFFLVLVDLLMVEGLKLKIDGMFYGKIVGYINDGLVLGGLVVVVVVFIVVVMSCVFMFVEVWDGKVIWGKFGVMVVVGVVLIVVVIWFVNEVVIIVVG